MVMEEQESDMELDSERIPVPQVQKSIEDSRVETSNKGTGVSRGKPRLRKKALHAAILKQMEFYFSDANLCKDRFLGNLIKEDPYVDLNTFIGFNKIRELTTDSSRIAKAIQESTMLSLSEDGTKVCRVTPIVEKKNTDDCTVYVQNLPSDTDHEMLSSIFSQYGSVAYVSVPRYKSNRKVKGFAFVEFDKPEYAQKCMKSFRKKGRVLPSHIAPDELLSITTFDDTEKDVTLLGRPAKVNENNECTRDVQGNEINGLEKNKGEDTAADETTEFDENKEKKKAMKRKHKDTETSDADHSIAEKDIDNKDIRNKKKKHKHGVDNNEYLQDDGNDVMDSQETMETTSSENQEQTLNNSQKKSSKHKNNVSTNIDEQAPKTCDQNNQNATTEGNVTINSGNEELENTNDDKKKKRKRKRKSKIEDVSDIMGFQVMAKRDWKYLRNKYLELQRSKMKQLKQHLRKTRWNQWSNYEKSKPEKEEHEEKEKISKQDNSSACRFSFTPGVIVKIQLDKPCTDPRHLKMELKVDKSLKYIDVTEGSYDAYVRCDTSEAAQVFAQKSNEEKRMTVLQGEEEQMYWDKIAHDREEKLGNKIRVKQRGRNKLLKKAEKELGKHIKFDEV